MNRSKQSQMDQNEAEIDEDKGIQMDKSSGLKYYTNKQNNSNDYNKNNTHSSAQKLFARENLSMQISELIKQNKYLQKQNSFLARQLQQKQHHIQILKQQIYQSILDQTQCKLHCIQIIQEEANVKAKKMFEERVGKLEPNDQMIEEMKRKIGGLELEIQKEKKVNQILAINVVQLKDFIIDAMREKDLIIKQLKSMILNSDDPPYIDINQAHKQYQPQKNKPQPYLFKNINPTNSQDKFKAQRKNQLNGPIQEAWTKFKDKYINQELTKNHLNNYQTSQNTHQIHHSQSFKTTKPKIVKNI